jgi:hypothetical protein
MSEGTPKGHAIETMQVEERRYKPDPEFSKQANAKLDIYKKSFDQFWTDEAKRITWFEPWKTLYEWKPPYAKFYLGGKLNVCYNCVDRHVEHGLKDKVAYFWEGEPENDRREITFGQLQKETVRFANALKKLGVKKGTHIGIYMGMAPELPIAMLACARIGAPFTVVFGGFSAEALDQVLPRGQAHRRRRADEAGPRRVGTRRLEGRERRSEVFAVRADGLRRPPLPSLYERHDGQAQGHHPHHWRIPRRRVIDAPLHL